MIDRSEAARCLAKCIAYVGCGQADKAEYWFRMLADVLGYARLLK